MADQREIIEALINELAAEVVSLEPGDLMAYGEVLSRLEQLTVVCEGADQEALGALAHAMKGLVEGLILGESDDQDKGVETLTEGITLGQSVFRGESEDSHVHGFLAGHGLAQPAENAGAESAVDGAGGEPDAVAEEPPGGPVPEEVEAAEAPAAAQAAQQAFNPEDMELLQSFVAEALEHLQSIEVNTLLLEDNPGDSETLNAVFRPFHTIKGVSGFLNLMDINHLAHSLENLLDQARSGAILLDSESIDVILAGVDILGKMIEDALAAAGEGRPRTVFDTSELERRIEDALTGGKAGGDGEQDEAVPQLGEILVDKQKLPPEAVEQALEAQKLRPDRRLGEILVSQGSVEPTQVADGLRTQRTMTTQVRSPQVQEVKVDTAKLDNLLDMVGELVIAQSMVQANPHVQAINDRKLTADLAQLSRITTDLQKSTMAMRMVPIKQTFQRMVRVVRDTAKKQGKLVKLELEGETTEIDRNMVEKFYEPLVHMVRNSVDHGLEVPEQRSEAGKPEEGLVKLAAYHKGGNVCIEITDDGRGLDREKILAKAIERGLVEAGDAEGLGDEEVFHFIFHPGFSTADKVTEISGRGVGMDVVQRTIDELRGKVEISSELGQGTVFTIALPLTLAIIDGMVVEVGAERFILPTVSVAESLRPQHADYGTVQGRGEMIKIRGNLLPMIRLHDVVAVEPENRDPWEALVVVVEHHGSQRCLLVDRLVGRQEVVIKSLGQSLKGVKVLAGGAIMGDGRVGLILDVEGVFKAHEGKAA